MDLRAINEEIEIAENRPCLQNMVTYPSDSPRRELSVLVDSQPNYTTIRIVQMLADNQTDLQRCES